MAEFISLKSWHFICVVIATHDSFGDLNSATIQRISRENQVLTNRRLSLLLRNEKVGFNEFTPSCPISIPPMVIWTEPSWRKTESKTELAWKEMSMGYFIGEMATPFFFHFDEELNSATSSSRSWSVLEIMRFRHAGPVGLFSNTGPYM